jgi:hypothetical protein
MPSLPPLGDLVAARDQLARQLHVTGDVRPPDRWLLRRPSVSAWADALVDLSLLGIIRKVADIDSLPDLGLASVPTVEVNSTVLASAVVNRTTG